MAVRTQAAAKQLKLESSVFSKAEIPVFGSVDTIMTHKAKSFSSKNERSSFYDGSERLSLTNASIARVRELHEANDTLQRQIARCEKELTTAHDPLSIQAEIEHCQTMLARNLGEILNIYSVNESRLRRIAELEAQNLELHKKMQDAQSLFVSTRDMQQRTQHASEFFLGRSNYERNLNELNFLAQE